MRRCFLVRRAWFVCDAVFGVVECARSVCDLLWWLWRVKGAYAMRIGAQNGTRGDPFSNPRLRHADDPLSLSDFFTDIPRPILFAPLHYRIGGIGCFFEVVRVRGAYVICCGGGCGACDAIFKVMAQAWSVCDAHWSAKWNEGNPLLNPRLRHADDPLSLSDFFTDIPRSVLFAPLHYRIGGIGCFLGGGGAGAVRMQPAFLEWWRVRGVYAMLFLRQWRGH